MSICTTYISQPRRKPGWMYVCATDFCNRVSARFFVTQKQNSNTIKEEHDFKYLENIRVLSTNKMRRGVCPGPCNTPAQDLTVHHIYPKRNYPKEKIPLDVPKIMICRTCHDHLEKCIPKHRLPDHDHERYFRLLEEFLGKDCIPFIFISKLLPKEKIGLQVRPKKHLHHNACTECAMTQVKQSNSQHGMFISRKGRPPTACVKCGSLNLVETDITMTKIQPYNITYA